MKPKFVLDYNDTTGEVNSTNHRMETYQIPRQQGKKYYKKIFFNQLEISVWNYFIIYGKAGSKKDSLEFISNLVEGLIEKKRNSTTVFRSD